jgi:hypothetical protein
VKALRKIGAVEKQAKNSYWPALPEEVDRGKLNNLRIIESKLKF